MEEFCDVRNRIRIRNEPDDYLSIEPNTQITALEPTREVNAFPRFLDWDPDSQCSFRISQGGPLLGQRKQPVSRRESLVLALQGELSHGVLRRSAPSTAHFKGTGLHAND